MSDQRANPARRIQHKLWVVERTDFKELLTAYFDGLPGYSTRAFSPTGVLEALKSKQELPDVLVITDYYLSGGFINGLKLIRHAQNTAPGVWTVLVNCGYSRLHIQGAIQATGISPDWVFHE